MKLTNKWNEKLIFTAEVEGHSVKMDTNPPLGSGSAITPKQLVIAGLTGCTAMDVMALMKKHKQTVETFLIDADVTPTEGSYPVVFKSIHLTYRMTGQVEPAKLLEAVKLSQSKYCGVSAMLAKAVPMDYSVELNGEVIGTGAPNFSIF